MWAKPIIVVECLECLDRLNEKLSRRGYSARGEFGIPGRRFYCKGGDERTHHLHAFEVSSPEIGRHIWFRDFLRESDEMAAACAALKVRLAEKYKVDLPGAGGRFVTSFRDYSVPVQGEARFIPVGSDENRILRCVLDCSEAMVTVNDLLYERRDGVWDFRISAYHKQFVTWVGNEGNGGAGSFRAKRPRFVRDGAARGASSVRISSASAPCSG
jgi:hypothetical protein